MAGLQSGPSRPDQGHFRIVQGEWLFDDEPDPSTPVASTPIPVDKVKEPSTTVAATLIPVDEVEMIEFIPYIGKPE